MKLIVAVQQFVARTRHFEIEDGQDLLEYALLVALIALVAIGAVATVGNTIYSVFWKSIETAASF
jgi:Flp pilus assembly pilin Flp